MKSIYSTKIKSLVIIFILLLGTVCTAQEITGEYEAIYATSNSYISYHLTLDPDGRFEFHFYRKNDCSSCVAEHQNGQGNWEARDKKLLLSADPETDNNDRFDLDLNGSKAHFIFKSPRDKSDKVIPTRLKFYESNVFWVKGMELFKK